MQRSFVCRIGMYASMQDYHDAYTVRCSIIRGRYGRQMEGFRQLPDQLPPRSTSVPAATCALRCSGCPCLLEKRRANRSDVGANVGPRCADLGVEHAAVRDVRWLATAQMGRPMASVAASTRLVHSLVALLRPRPHTCHEF